MAVSLTDLAARRQLALDHVQGLIAHCEQQTRFAWKGYYALQTATVLLAAITPCLIFIAKGNPDNDFIGWLQLFFPAVAAVTAGASHIFHWREDGVRFTALGESLRSELWRFQTRTGDYGPTLDEEQALDHLVTQVDALNLRTIAQWSADRLAAPAADSATPAKAASPAVQM